MLTQDMEKFYTDPKYQIQGMDKFHADSRHKETPMNRVADPSMERLHTDPRQWRNSTTDPRHGQIPYRSKGVTKG